MEIVSERLLLRPWTRDDIAHAQRLWGDPDVMRYIDVRGGLSRTQVLQKLEFEINGLKQNGVQYWPVFERQSGDFAGCCGLKPWLHSPRGGYEMGFHLVKEKWGKGYALEAGRAVIAYGFGEKKLSHLMAGHHPENENSKKVLLKLGFRYLEPVFFPPTGLVHLSYRLDPGDLD